MEKEKLEAIELWTNDPCGAADAEKYGIGSEKFFNEVMGYRYNIYAPWLKKAIVRLEVRNKKILEVGCGMGMDLLQFAKRGAKVVGIDLVSYHIELAQELFKMKISSRNYEIFQADAESLPFKNESFDLVYSFGVLHHTPNIKKAIREIWRVLKPDGKVMVGLYHRNSYYYWFNLFFIQGIIKRRLHKMTMDEILRRTEFSRSEAKPLVKVYSRRDCYVLFKDFINVKVRTYHFTNDQIFPSHINPFFSKYLSCFDFLGWYVLSSGSKSALSNQKYQGK